MPKTDIPRLTHLQFALLSLVNYSSRPASNDHVTGKELRAELYRRFDIKRSGPSFYLVMARLEKAKWVKGWYTQEVIDSQLIKSRVYQITVKGQELVGASKLFYSRP